MAHPTSSSSPAPSSGDSQPLRRSRRQQNTAPELADDVLADELTANATTSSFSTPPTGRTADGSTASDEETETAEFADARESPGIEIDIIEEDIEEELDEDEELDDDDDDDDDEEDDDYEEGEEFDELEDDDDGDETPLVLNLTQDQARRLIQHGEDDIDGEDNFGNNLIRIIQASARNSTAGQNRRIMNALRNSGFISQAAWNGFLSDDLDDNNGMDDDDEDGEEHTRGYGSLRARRRRGQVADAFPKVPSDEGRALMESGEFGTNEGDGHGIQMKRRKRLAARIMRRELGLDSPGAQRRASGLTAQSLIPQSRADTIIHYDSRCYSGQFSDDGNFFFSCSQDFQVRMYDSSNPYDWKYYKSVQYPYGQWTITDASLSPDNRWLAYSSIRSLVCLAPTDPNETSEPELLDFADHNRDQGREARRAFGHRAFGIWSIRFSGDGRELVAGTSDNSVYAYDIETRRPILRIDGHYDEVNAVCFGDKQSPHLLYSGSDDSNIKVWDRRSMSDNRAAGVFLGHTEGITYVDSKGDGRYVLSNGKDQTMKLWDLRKMMSSEEAERIDVDDYSTGFDYRFQPYSEARYKRHPYDSSVVTFRGHKVLKTLIRCHFSPPGSTDSRYVYSGSEDGCVYIYNLDATLAGKVNVNAAGSNFSSAPDDEDYDYHDHFATMWDDGRGARASRPCVRDASWHPYAPVIAATSWNGHTQAHGTCTIHTWNDGLEEDEAEPAMGQRVDEVLRPSRGFDGEDSPGPRTRNGNTRGLRGGRRNGYDV